MKYSLMLALFVLAHFSIAAQALSIKGTVRDAETGEALLGVTVQERNSSNYGISDAQGEYAIEVSRPDAVLRFAYLGYTTREVEAAARNTIDVTLLPAITALDEVVVTALGLERSYRDLGYAVQSLDGQAVSEVKSANFVDGLAGRIAGLSVSQGATGVGSTSKITIRGESSFTNNNPLFVVDGIPINNNSIINRTNDAAAGFQEVDFGNGAMEVNADDIASVSVLKGPGAAALYGTRAANGVILITTKTGEDQRGLGIGFQSSLFLDQPFQLPRFQNEFGQGNSGDFAFVDGLGGGINDNITYSWGPRMDAGLLLPQFDSPVPLPDGSVVRGGDVAVHGGAPITPSPFLSYPDNLKDFYQTGVTAFNNLSVGAGFDKGSYRLSLSDLRSESIIPGVDLNRQSASARFSFSPNSRLHISAAAQLTSSQSGNRPASGYGSENVNYSLVAWGPRSLDINALRDYWQPGLEQVQQYSYNYTFFDNPYFTLLENRNGFRRGRAFGHVMASYAFDTHWSLQLRTGMDRSSEKRTFRRHFSSNRFANGAYAEQDVSYREYNTDVLLNYRRALGWLKLDVSAGANRMDQEATSVQAQALALAQPSTFKFSNAAVPVEIVEAGGQKRINSVYGLAKFSVDETFFLELTGRNDWSSALATPVSAEGVSFFYPSAAGSFVLSKAMVLPEVVSFAKLRASWAQVGNDTNPYQTAGIFLAQTPFNGQPAFSAQSLIPNSRLLPEQTTAVEVGADLHFWESKLRVDATYYNALTANQIIALPVSISSGYDEQVVNGGSVRAQGVEVVLGLTPVYGKGLRWDAYFNFARSVATVERLPKEVDRLALAYSRVYDNVNQTVWFLVEEGGRIGDMYGTGYQRNENGDFIIDGNGNYIADNNLQKLGNYNPDFSLGFSNDLSYKNWQFSFLLDWRHGGVLVSRSLALAAVGGQLIETQHRPEAGIVAEGVVNVGTQEAPDWQPNTTAVTAESYYRQFYDRNHEENNTYDASFLKLRALSLGYTFSGRDSGFFQNGRELSIALIGRNLFAWSAIPHFDPEQLAVQGQQFVSGVEDMSYATTRSFGLKIGVQF